MLNPFFVNHTLRKLIAGGRRHIDVLTLLGTESYFRPFAHRFLEYAFWALLKILQSKTILDVSVGICQAKYKYWLDSGILTKETSIIKSIEKFSNPLVNYDVCHFILYTKGCETRSDEDIISLYAGQYQLSYHFVYKCIKKGVGHELNRITI